MHAQGGRAHLGCAHTQAVLTAGSVDCGQHSPWATHTPGQCSLQAVHSHTDGAHCQLCTHTGSAHHMPHAIVDAARLDSVSFHCSLWYMCRWFMWRLALLGKDWLMSPVCVTLASGLWWLGPGKGRAGWPAESGSVPQHTVRAACEW